MELMAKKVEIYKVYFEIQRFFPGSNAMYK